jgi:DNA-binding NtrC family response regulator
VRELRNLIESMVVLSPGREIQPEDIPPQIRDSGATRFLPVHVGPVTRAREGAEGRELEFILRSLVELKLQMEELRRRVDDYSAASAHWLGELRGAEVRGAASFPMVEGPGVARGIEPRDQSPPPNTATILAGMTMADVERAAIEVALRETRGNRRKAAEMLQIGERTLYRKLREYQLPIDEVALD